MNEEHTDAEYVYLIFITLLIHKAINLVIAIFVNMWNCKVILYWWQ